MTGRSITLAIIAFTLVSCQKQSAAGEWKDPAKDPTLDAVRYWPQPDFKYERLFKVEDQFGCKWWINSGHKFDSEWPVLTKDGTPDCPSPDLYPPQSVDYRQKAAGQ